MLSVKQEDLQALALLRKYVQAGFSLSLKRAVCINYENIH